MPRKSKSEYVAEKRRAYANSGKARRSRILDGVCGLRLPPLELPLCVAKVRIVDVDARRR